MGELLSVSEAEGEHLAMLGISEPFPFRHGYAATLSPLAGTAFGLVIAPKGSFHQLQLTISPF